MSARPKSRLRILATRLAIYNVLMMPIRKIFWRSKCIETVPAAVHYVEELVEILTRGHLSKICFVIVRKQSLCANNHIISRLGLPGIAVRVLVHLGASENANPAVLVNYKQIRP